MNSNPLKNMSYEKNDFDNDHGSRDDNIHFCPENQ